MMCVVRTHDTYESLILTRQYQKIKKEEKTT